MTGAARILLVEDDADDARLARLAFSGASAGCDLRICGDAEEALRLLESGGAALPDLVVLDLNLPGMQGHELLERLRADPRWAGLRVAVLSSSGEPSDRRRAAAAQGYFQKPDSFSGLVALVPLLLACGMDGAGAA